ncbi:MAG TPA: hypothetical protein GXZ90_00745 [Clostridiales bacterium]|nr:hypothetical protein [Clostridiales bacterium]
MDATTTNPHEYIMTVTIQKGNVQATKLFSVVTYHSNSGVNFKAIQE